MADLTVTITNSLNTFGQGPTTKWGVGDSLTMTWGSSKWGEGTQDIPTDVIKVVENSQASTTTVGFAVTHLISDQQVITPTSSVLNAVDRTIDGQTITTTSDVTDLRLQTGDWFYEFIDRTADADDQRIDGFTAVSDVTTTWAETSDVTTTWTEVA